MELRGGRITIFGVLTKNFSDMSDEKFLGISIETTCIVMALKEVLINTPELQEKFIKSYEGFKNELLSKAPQKDVDL